MTDGPSDLELRRRQFKAQQSTVQTRRQQAVCVRRAYKRYGSKNHPNVILDGLNMTVPKGCIYGLLGASGCGKTTLLNCIVGRKRLNSGEIWVLGGTPGSKGSGVPGPRIGYMPQEIALYGEFSIRETLKYFGWVSDKTTEEVEAKLDFLIHFLMLPDADRQVKCLSGGQQRRVSLAAALVHDPELLILDEPTVGVDPLLRQNIWNYLVEITKHGKNTVIITTHYIDETRQAHLIGLMRGGYFLAEESPEQLITQFGAQSLEDVFLKLSVIQNVGKRRRSSILQGVTESIPIPEGAVNDAAVLDDEVGEISGEFGDNISMSSRTARRVSIAPDATVETIPPALPQDDIPETRIGDYFKVVKWSHMHALVWKNFLWMWRNIPIMAFIIGLPVAQTVLFCLSIGHDPKDITVSVVNYEINYPMEHCEYKSGCNATYLSCNYLDYVQHNYSLVMNYYATEDEARRSVEKGQSWAVMVVPQNFSESLRSRIDNGKDTPAWDLANSIIDVFADKSNENIATFLTRDFLFGIENYAKEFLRQCDLDPKVFGRPIRKLKVQDASDSALEQYNSHFTQAEATEYAQGDFTSSIPDLLQYENKMNLKIQSDISSSSTTIISESVSERSDNVDFSGFEDSCSEITANTLTMNPELLKEKYYFAEPITIDYNISFFDDRDNNMQNESSQTNLVNMTNAEIKNSSAITSNQLQSAVPNSVPDSHHEILHNWNSKKSDNFAHEVPNDDFQDFESSESEYIPSDSSLSCESPLDLDITNRKKKSCNIIEEKLETTNLNDIEITLSNKKTDLVNTGESKESKYPQLETRKQEKAQTKEDHLSFPDYNHNQQYIKKPCARERPTLCPLCYEDVITHFPRHLFRRHKNNTQVKQIKSLKAGSKERLAMLAALRKQGYFLLNVEKNIVTPTRTSKNPDTDYFVCSFCLGHYTKQLLYKHVKLCKQKPDNIVGPGRNCLSTSQTFLASAVAKNEEFLKTSRIKNEVMQIMRPDDISMVAKTDPLICLYGEYLLVKHKRRQIAVAVSNKMREMARMLQVIRSSKPGNKSFFDLLKPEMFGTFIFAAKVISGYDEHEKDFKAPSLALHMGTNLKQICDVAFKLVLENKKIPNISWDDKGQKKSEIKDLKKIIEGHWCNEISSLALKMLQEKKWKKPTQLPLANDIVVFQTYLNNLAEKAYESIARQIEIKRNYKTLTECVLALTVMFNRKRIGDVQYLTIETYSSGSGKVEQQTLTEALTPVEKIISKQFRRIVTGGKGSRPVPTIFSKLVQKYITCLLKIRKTSDIVPKTNPYLFANPGSIDKWMAGANIIRRLAKNSEAQQPALLTSTRFRKHIATTLQLMTMEPEDMEQIATFMGHTQKTHAEFYRIIFFMAVALTSGAMLLERNEGILERSLVNGITGTEILFSQVITQFVVMFGQTMMVLLFAFWVFQLTQNGNWILVFALTVLSGVCGMCFGFMIACTCENERSATYLALGSFLPIVMLCGIIWPIEAMSPYLKWASTIMPLTQATESLRCILARGWGIHIPVVYYGFLSISLWIFIFLISSILVLKFKKG